MQKGMKLLNLLQKKFVKMYEKVMLLVVMVAMRLRLSYQIQQLLK